jgi:hypothetical protein
MVRASRLMPQLVPRRASRLALFVVVSGASAGYVSLLWHFPVATSLVSAAIVVWTIAANRRWRRHLAAMAASREDEGICSFVRALPIRGLDTWVVRATFEEIQGYLQHGPQGFPLRPSDRLVEDLDIDPEDLEDIAVTIADRAGRTWEGYQANPHYAGMTTAEDLIEFLSAQPKAQPNQPLQPTSDGQAEVE